MHLDHECFNTTDTTKVAAASGLNSTCTQRPTHIHSLQPLPDTACEAGNLYPLNRPPGATQSKCPNSLRQSVGTIGTKARVGCSAAVPVTAKEQPYRLLALSCSKAVHAANSSDLLANSDSTMQCGCLTCFQPTSRQNDVRVTRHMHVSQAGWWCIKPPLIIQHSCRCQLQLQQENTCGMRTGSMSALPATIHVAAKVQ